MIKKELYEKVKFLSELNKISSVQVNEIELIIKTHITPKYSLCTKCRAQIRHAQVLLKNWLRDQEIIEDVISNAEVNPEPILLTDDEVSLEFDEESAKKEGCTKCLSKRKKTESTTTTKTKRAPRTKK